MKKYFFTLIEVVISLAILASAVASYMFLSSQAVRSAAFGITIWENTHRLAQAAEYALTVGPEQMNVIPNFIFPYGDYSANYFLTDPVDMPTTQKLDEMETLPRRLKTIIVTVRNNLTGTEEKIMLDAIVYTGEGEGL